MSELQAEFEQAQEDVQGLSQRPANDDMLALYANYKQATVGDATGKRPSMLDMVGRAKYDAWAKVKGTSTDDAMSAYVDKVRALQATHG